MIIDSADTKKATRNEEIHNNEIIVSTYLHQALHKANKWDFMETKSSLLVPLGIGSVNEALIDAKNRGIRLRFITEITKDNVSRCKDTMTIAELKHLEGVREFLL